MNLADNYIHLRNHLNHHIKVVSEIQASEAPQISAQKIHSLDNAIQALESFYREYGIIKFCTHTIQLHPPLSRARRIKQQINKKQPKGANGKILHSIKTYFDLKKGMIASRRETKTLYKQENFAANFQLLSKWDELKTGTEKLQNFYKEHRLIKFLTNTIYKPFKKTQLTNSILIINKLQAIVETAFDFTPLPGAPPVDLDDIYSPMQTNFSKRISALFTDTNKVQVENLVKQHLESRSYGTLNEQKIIARLKDLETIVQDLEPLELSDDDDEASEAFIVAVLFGREDPSIYLEGNKITTPTRIQMTELEERLSFFNGRHFNEDAAKAEIIKAFENAEQNHHDHLISNIFVNIAHLQSFYEEHVGMNLMTFAQLISSDIAAFAGLLPDA